MGATLVCFVLGAWLFADVYYYVRSLVVYIFARFFRSRISIVDASVVYGIVTTTDGDIMFSHMNNARVLREYDFARFDHGARCGMIEMMFKRRGAVAAHTIRYRLPLQMFSRYKIVTQPVHWDNKFVYVSQQIITLSDGIVRCVGYSKIAANFDLDAFVKENFPHIQKPEIPEDMQKWMEYNELSSQMMKAYANGKCNNSNNNENDSTMNEDTCDTGITPENEKSKSNGTNKIAPEFPEKIEKGLNGYSIEKHG